MGFGCEIPAEERDKRARMEGLIMRMRRRTEILDGTNPEYLEFSYRWRDSYMDPSRFGYFHHGVFTHRYNSPSNGSSGVALHCVA